jgi:hypothetical protein
MANLYQLSHDLQAALDSAFDPDTGEMLPEFEEKRELFVSKGAAVAAYILNCEADAAAAKQALDRIKAVHAAYERKADKLREYLLANMAATGITSIKADDRTFSVSVKEGRESVEIEEGAVFDASLCLDPKPPEPSKEKIKAAILAGQPVAGARIVSKPTLSIK